MKLRQDEIETVRNQADIVDVISHYIPVQRQGKQYKAICPFHDDHDPSLSISPEKKIYRCFVCQNGGNVFTFVQNFEKVSFVEAVEKVANLCGIHLTVEQTTYEKPKDPHIEALHNVLQETIDFTMYQLDTPEAIHIKEYLEKRNLNHDVRKVFQIGYNPQNDALTRFLKAKGYQDRDCISANVTRLNESGIHDVFTGRIMFPLHDMYGNPIGFSARTIDPNNDRKYINTTETDVFKKGDIVYNLHRARSEARRKGCIYICEGVTDVIAFYQAGIENAICTLGTACTQHQLQLLKNCSAKLIFCYDGDNAGQRATYKAAKLALSIGCDVAVVSNKTKKDPDEIIREYGKQALQKLVAEPIAWMEFVLQYFTAITNMDNYLDKKEMVQKVLEEINHLQDDMDRQYFTQQLSKLTGFQITYQKKQTEPVYTENKKKLIVPSGIHKAEEMIVSMMMHSLQASSLFEEDLGYLITDTYQKLAYMIIDANHTYGKADSDVLIDMSNEQEIKNLITQIITSDIYQQPYEEEKLKGAMRKIKIEVLAQEADQYKQQLTNALNPTSLQLLMQKYNECLKEKRRLMNEESKQTNLG